MNTSTQKTNLLEYEYDYFSMYSSTMTLECNHDYFHYYFNKYPVSTVKATSMESCVILFLLLHVPISSVLTDYCYPDVIIIINQMTFSCVE